MTPEEREALGVHDPAAPAAAERLRLLRLVEASGGTAEQIAAAGTGLARLAAELLFLSGDERLTMAEVAEAAGIPYDAFGEMWRAAGFPRLDDVDRRFTNSDVELARVYYAARSVFGADATLQLVRVVGASMSRIADATISTFWASIGGASIDADPDGATLVQANALAVGLLPQLTSAMEAMLRQHLVHIAPGRGDDDAPSTGFETRSLAVGFVDVVASTSLAQRLPLAEVGAAIARFEAVAADLVTAGGGRVVKFIGDEAMFTHSDPAEACRLGLGIVAALGADAALAGARSGLAFGDILVRDGDCFGPVVNLAARATAAARPNAVLVTDDLRRAVGQGAANISFTPIPLKEVHGFDAPVRFHLVE